jgi:hypothetical protein
MGVVTAIIIVALWATLIAFGIMAMTSGCTMHLHVGGKYYRDKPPEETVVEIGEPDHDEMARWEENVFGNDRAGDLGNSQGAGRH